MRRRIDGFLNTPLQVTFSRSSMIFLGIMIIVSASIQAIQYNERSESILRLLAQYTKLRRVKMRTPDGHQVRVMGTYRGLKCIIETNFTEMDIFHRKRIDKAILVKLQVPVKETPSFKPPLARDVYGEHWIVVSVRPSMITSYLDLVHLMNSIVSHIGGKR